MFAGRETSRTGCRERERAEVSAGIQCGVRDALDVNRARLQAWFIMPGLLGRKNPNRKGNICKPLETNRFLVRTLSYKIIINQHNDDERR